ncbi:aminopeptidase [Bradyrhizobium sp. LM2.7]
MTDQRITSTPIDPVKLDRLAEVAVKVGLGLRPGQDLLLTAPAIALPLVRRIAVHAYKAGVGIVTPILSDEEMTLARYRHGHDNSFDRAAGWLYEGMAKAFADNTARLAIVGDNPMLLSGEDPSKVARASKANSMAYQPALEKIVNFDTNWNIIAYPSPSWAKQVFPNDSEEVAIGKLADAIFAASRVDREDAMANWASHNAVLRERTNWLNGQRFRALQYTGPGIDLTIGLADGHEWEGGASLSKNGISCNANIPTEEVFTTPHCRRVYGHVVSSKPLSYQGTLIDNIAVRFEDGRIVDAKASRGAEVLNKVLDTDEGARRLGEVALVPHSSPISQSGLLFYNTLFDENAASHIALGQCYSKCFVNGAQLTPQQIAAQGGNQSLIHIDWMIAFGRDRHRRHPGRRQQGPGVPQGRVGEVGLAGS